MNFLEDLLSLDDDLFYVDLMALLSDPTESLEIRARAAELSNGQPRMTPLLIELLERDDIEPVIAFWCIYALHSDPKGESILRKYTDDHRVVDPGMDPFVIKPPTLAMEAEWALKMLSGDWGADPEWMRPDEDASVQDH